MEDSKGIVEKEVDGYFGKEKFRLPPMPKYPIPVHDRYGFESLYVRKFDEYFGVFAKFHPDGGIDIATLNNRSWEDFPDYPDLINTTIN